MSEILFQYHRVDPTTWVYVSSLMMIALYFKFNRFWSVRNLDLVLLILLAPGLLMVNQARHKSHAETIAQANAAADDEAKPATKDGESARAASAAESANRGEAGAAPASATDSDNGRRLAYVGYLWLLGISAVWLARLLLDPTMVRRPLLEPNLTNGGLIFAGCALFCF
jgi:hypothetical protein